MFGITKNHLCKSDKNQTSHRFNYCGTCKSIGSIYGHKSRLFLNYDVVFLSALLNGQLNQKNEISAYNQSACFAMPDLRDVPQVFQYTSAVNVFLASIKILDNVKDHKNLDKLKWSSMNILYKKKFNKAKDELLKFGLQTKSIDQFIKKNYKNESVRNLSLENYYNPTSEITAMIFKHGAEIINKSKKISQQLETIGKELGKLVYCA